MRTAVVVGLSLISNPAAGIAKGPLNHEEVTQAGKDYAKHFARLLEMGFAAPGSSNRLKLG